MQRLAEILSGRGRSVAEKRHTAKDVAGKEKLTKKIKQLTARTTELDGAVARKMNAAADLNIKLVKARK